MTRELAIMSLRAVESTLTVGICTISATLRIPGVMENNALCVMLDNLLRSFRKAYADTNEAIRALRR